VPLPKAAAAILAAITAYQRSPGPPATQAVQSRTRPYDATATADASRADGALSAAAAAAAAAADFEGREIPGNIAASTVRGDPASPPTQYLAVADVRLAMYAATEVVSLTAREAALRVAGFDTDTAPGRAGGPGQASAYHSQDFGAHTSGVFGCDFGTVRLPQEAEIDRVR
jgi:hypothetical protein